MKLIKLQFGLFKTLFGGRRRLMIVGVVGLVAALALGGMTVLGGGGGEDEFDTDLLVEFGDEPAFADGPAGEDFVMEAPLTVEEQVERTVAAMGPQPTVAPTPDVGATLTAERAATREAMSPVIASNPLSPASGLSPYLSDREIRQFSDMGTAMWSATSLWLHLRQVVYRDIEDWTDGSVEVHIALAGTEFQVLESRWSRTLADARSNEALGEEVKGYIDQLDEGVQALREVYLQLQTTQALISSLDGELELAARETLAQARSEMMLGMDRFVQVMGRYGCAVCGELIRQSGG